MRDLTRALLGILHYLTISPRTRRVYRKWEIAP